MDFDELKKNWQSEISRPQGAADRQKLLLVVERQCNGLERSAHRRDVREIVEAVVVVACFAAGWPIFRHSLAASLGIAFIVLGYLIIVLTRLSTRRPDPVPLDASVREFAQQRLAWIDRQMRLLTTGVWWYATPSFIGLPLAAWGLTAGNRLHFILLLAFIVAASVHYVRSRRKTARNQWQPVRDEVAQLITALGTIDGLE